MAFVPAGVLRSVRVHCAIVAVLLVASVAPSQAQRPAPPKSWVIDTASGKPVATRRGGMMSSDAKVELFGPFVRDPATIASWLSDYARTDAGAMGSLGQPAAKDRVDSSRTAGQMFVHVAHIVQTPTGNRYLAYAVLQDGAAGAPSIVLRSTYGDALTFARTLRQGFEAILPYMQTPTPSMRTAVVAAARPPRSFRDVQMPTQATVDTQAAPVSTTTPTTAAAGTVSPNSDTSTARAVEATLAAAANMFSTAPALQLVVFYQWGDLQYHPVALFKDGSTFDLDTDPVDRIDVARSKAAEPKKWGRWRNVGKRYYLTSGDNGSVSDWELGTALYTALPAPPATTLDTTYKAVSGSIMGETSSLVTSRLTFTRNGRFTSGTDFAAVGSGEVTGVTMAAGASKSKMGRYRIEGHKIVLTYDDGVTKELFFAFGTEGSPARLDRDLIFIGDTAFVTID